MEPKRETPPNSEIIEGEPSRGKPPVASDPDAGVECDHIDISLGKSQTKLSFIQSESGLTIQIGRLPGVAVFCLRILVFACVAFSALSPVLAVIFTPGPPPPDTVEGWCCVFIFCAVTALFTLGIPVWLIWPQTLCQLIKIENGDLVICRRSLWSVEARFPVASVGAIQIRMATRMESDEGESLTWEFKGIEPTIRLGFWDMTTVFHGHGVIINCAGHLICIALGLSRCDADELVRLLNDREGRSERKPRTLD